jgi:ankyrin repeat protein
VHALIAAGADVFRPHAGTLTTAVHFAAREGNTDTLKALLLEIQAGANAGEDKIAAELAKVDEHGNTALLLAALSGWTTAANVMFALTPAREWAVMANINGNTALQVGSFFSVSSQFIEALLAEKEIRATIEHGAHLNGRTALILAVSSNKVDNVKALLAHGAATELEPIDGQEAVSAYNVAVHTANQPLQKLLRAHEKGHEEL